MQLDRIIHSSYLDPVVEIVQHEDPVASDLLCFQHGLEVGQQLHVLAHVSGQNLQAPTNQRGARSVTKPTMRSPLRGRCTHHVYHHLPD